MAILVIVSSNDEKYSSNYNCLELRKLLFAIILLIIRGELRFANTSENTTKKQLYKVLKEKVEISLELVIIRLHLVFKPTPY